MTDNGGQTGPGGVRVYRTQRGQSFQALVIGRLIVLLFIAAFTVGIGWLVARQAGALVGAALALAVVLFLEMVTVFEVSIFPDGQVEFRSFLRRTRVLGARIEEITGDLDEDEGIRSYSVRVGTRWRILPLEEDADIAAFLADLKRINPDVCVTGVWPEEVTATDKV